jgi:hypothetical protein
VSTTTVQPFIPPIARLAEIGPPAVEIVGREWQRRLRLLDWNIVFTVGVPVADAEALGEIVADDHYEQATIRIHPSVTDRRELNVTIVHELAHLLQRDLDAAVGSAEPCFRSPSVWTVWAERWDHEREKHVEKLAQLLVDQLGAV